VQVPDVHSYSLGASTALTGYYVTNAIAPLEVIRVLNGAGVRFMLVGLHGIGGWMQKPRATEDVDVLVAARGHKKAITALLAAFPVLEADDQEVVTRLRDSQTKVVRIDVMKPNQPLFREMLKHTHRVEAEGQVYNIPSLEAAIAMKFAPMVSLNRAGRDRLQDAHDFMYIVDTNPDIDLDQLAVFGQLVYNGGGVEIVEKVRQVRAGETLRV
jgi:hypothetical protein